MIFPDIYSSVICPSDPCDGWCGAVVGMLVDGFGSLSRLSRQCCWLVPLSVTPVLWGVS